MKFKWFKNIEIQSFILLINVKMPTTVHFNISEQDKSELLDAQTCAVIFLKLKQIDVDTVERCAEKQKMQTEWQTLIWSQSGPMFDLKINVGHCDLYFVV